jgi:glycosyltransferase involved in cell wall biosynthesis
MPAVSVIMPAYNVAPYLPAAIESVLAQTFGDLELIVVDDGATDESPRIAEEYARRDGRIRVRHRPNGGISAARNTAFREAQGAVFALLDGDDLWEPEYLASQLAMLERRPDVDIVTGNARFLGGPGDGHPARPFPDTRPDPDLATILADETAVFILSVLRRRVYDAIGGFDEAFRTNEDYDFWLRAALAGFRFARNDRPLGRYRRRDDSLSADDVKMVRGILRVYAKIGGLLDGRPAEAALVEAQIARFTTLRHEVEARHALVSRDFAAAAAHLAALHERRGGARLALARLMARWTPGLLARAYDMRRRRRGMTGTRRGIKPRPTEAYAARWAARVGPAGDV